ncbi:SubName: Full=Uncharacterized protein {ECO:0000313/EMBL:CCA76337.1} [Serendipita indica DSM 11827]|uniref:Uncharacterized protein n=1 Tax=Serendipita indica (strain DSM 11827) TaxID=1109443 RepID=G4TYE4_SERID|nr:SubName: Full=Uncharacterized protein {ECO:0000313/EMBL:CCA76337.1} [Serendipita indica DSM 11827]CCA76337.1 hypothetical protein PIIN_10332 [Serendipita indica DSM 11827]
MQAKQSGTKAPATEQGASTHVKLAANGDTDEPSPDGPFLNANGKILIEVLDRFVEQADWVL